MRRLVPLSLPRFSGMDLGEVCAVATALEPSQVLRAYRLGMFPMGLGDDGAPPYGWWSPERRGVLFPGRLKVSKSLRKSLRRFEWSVDQDFSGVVAGCADPGRTGRWINEDIARVYFELHRAGHAHSIEIRRDGELVGGLYGVSFGRVFAGESMFHRVADASKAALCRLVEVLDSVHGESGWLVDTQWLTPHLSSLGVSEISRVEYHAALARALRDHRSQDFPKR